MLTCHILRIIKAKQKLYIPTRFYFCSVRCTKQKRQNKTVTISGSVQSSTSFPGHAPSRNTKEQ